MHELPGVGLACGVAYSIYKKQAYFGLVSGTNLTTIYTQQKKKSHISGGMRRSRRGRQPRCNSRWVREAGA
nr:MAG TPA: hypothetical protein [Bacteriophage sp.]